MQTFFGSNGLEYTANCESSVTKFEDLVTSYLSFGRQSGPLMKSLLHDDPAMPMTLCMQGYFQKLFANTLMSERAKDTFTRLKSLANLGKLNDREKQHIIALGSWTEGDLQRTVDIWEHILIKNPLDSLALRMAHYLHFYSGAGERMRDSVLRVLPYWNESHANYGFVLGMCAFGFEETGDFIKAERYARDAININELDIWAIHAMAHVFEMQQRYKDGIEWIDSLELHWSQANNFRFHLVWHRSLYEIELGNFDIALKSYDEHLISDLESGFNLDLCNAASILWRLIMHDVDISDRWLRLAEISCEHINDRDLAFVTLHYLMSLLGARDHSSSQAMLRTIQSWASDNSTQGSVLTNSGLPLSQALRKIHDGNFSGAIGDLMSVRYSMDEIGGSKAQRDVFEMLLLYCIRKSGDGKLAETVYAERTINKPGSAWGWHWYAHFLEMNGRSGAAAQAREKEQALLL